MFDPLAAALAVDKAMKEGHEETLEGPEEALERPWETQKKKKRSAPGFEPRTSSLKGSCSTMLS